MVGEIQRWLKKINNSRSPIRENTKVIKGRHEMYCGVFDCWYTRPSKDISPIKKAKLRSD